MVLTHYASCCPSTSMIERRFSKLEKIYGTRVCNTPPESLLDTLEVIETVTPQEREQLIELARECQ